MHKSTEPIVNLSVRVEGEYESYQECHNVVLNGGKNILLKNTFGKNYDTAGLCGFDIGTSTVAANATQSGISAWKAGYSTLATTSIYNYPNHALTWSSGYISATNLNHPSDESNHLGEIITLVLQNNYSYTGSINEVVLHISDGATRSGYTRNVLSSTITKSSANKLTVIWTCSFTASG